MATTQSEQAEVTLSKEEQTPKRLQDIEGVRDHVTQLVKAGDSEKAIEILLDLLMQMKDAHTATSVRLQNALRQLYGRRSEKISPNQLELFLSSMVKGPEEEEKSTTNTDSADDALASGFGDNPIKRRKSRGPRGRAALPAHLERRVTQLTPDPAQCTCEHCGTEKTVMSHEKSERLEFEPACFFVRVQERPVLSCPKCKTGVVCAEAGDTPLEGALPGEGLLSQIVTAKFKDGLPLYRQQRIYEKRYGVRIPISSLGDWSGSACELLLPLIPLLKERTLKDFLVQTDDTGVRVLDKKTERGSKRGHIWVYAGQGGNVFADYTPSWSGEGPQAILMHREGYIQVDGYAGYDELFKGDAPRIEVACWMHARRGFEKAHQAGDCRGTIILGLIQKIYQVEKKANQDSVDPEERLKRRLTQSASVYEEIFSLLDDWAPKVPPKILLGKAITYARNRYVQLGRFLEDGRIPLDNGEVERLIRLIALIRKNCLFFGSDQGAERGAVAISLTLACDRVGLDPFSYFRDVLPKLGASRFPISRLEELLPENWAKNHRDDSQVK